MPGFTHTVRQTAAGAIALPAQGLYLSRIRIGQASGNVPGDVAVLYDGISVAHFPTASTAGATQDGFAEYAMNVRIPQNQMAAGLFTWTGTVSWVEWTFTEDAPGDGASWSDHRAILFRRTDGMATTATITVTYDAGESVPDSILALATPATRGRFQFPATGGFQGQAECESPPTIVFGPKTRSLERIKAPALKASTQLVLTGISDAATTIMALVYYHPRSAT